MQIKPRADNIKHEYEVASIALKRVLCKNNSAVQSRLKLMALDTTGFTLELGWDSPQLPIVSEGGLNAARLGYQHLVASRRAEARSWDTEGRALGLW